MLNSIVEKTNIEGFYNSIQSLCRDWHYTKKIHFHAIGKVVDPHYKVEPITEGWVFKLNLKGLIVPCYTTKKIYLKHGDVAEVYGTIVTDNKFYRNFYHTYTTRNICVKEIVVKNGLQPPFFSEVIIFNPGFLHTCYTNGVKTISTFEPGYLEFHPTLRPLCDQLAFDCTQFDFDNLIEIQKNIDCIIGQLIKRDNKIVFKMESLKMNNLS